MNRGERTLSRRYRLTFAATVALIPMAAIGAVADWDDRDGFERDDDLGRFCEVRELTCLIWPR